MSVPLDSRVVRILRWLLNQDGPRSTSDLASDLGLSERVIRYRLSAVQNFFHSHGASLERQRGTGLRVKATKAQRLALVADLDSRVSAPSVYAPEERQHLLLDSFLWRHPEALPVERLNEELEVSKTSARRDLRKAEPWLEAMGLPVLRKPTGLWLSGSEQLVRRALVQLFLEAVPGDVLDELSSVDLEAVSMLEVRVPVGLRNRLSSLKIRECAEVIREGPLRDRLGSGNCDLTYALYVAITECRIGQSRPIEMEPGKSLSLIEDPASEVVRDLTEALEERGAAHFSDDEVAGLTEYLLGLDALLSEPTSTSELDGLVNDMLEVASVRLHESLAVDDELRRSLTMHLNRLVVRLRYGLPIYNPLVDELAERYPDVQAVAVDLGVLVGERLNAAISADEVGFIAMYLCGALERGHLLPRRRAMVVCPSGMATAWVLVSRLRAEFPELALAEVVSASLVETMDVSEFDMIISTVPLPTSEAAVIVVSPLLSAADIQSISAML